MASRVRTISRRVRFRIGDGIANRRYVRGPSRILLTRHPVRRARFYDGFLEWLADEHPSVRSRFELCTLPYRPRDPRRYALHVPWLQDPVQAWSAEAYAEALALSRCLAEHGVPTVNPIDRLPHAAKAEGARRIARAGIRTPETRRIEEPDDFRDTHYGLRLPFIVREDWGHASKDALERQEVVLLRTPEDVAALDLTTFSRPVAMAFVDTRDPEDGRYRKYRCLVAGDVSVPFHLLEMDHWFVKGRGTLYSDGTRARDLAYLEAPDPNHDRLVAAREQLELDVVAFDYAYTPSGELVVFEANPFPFIQFKRGRRSYRNPAVARSYAAMAACYVAGAGHAPPQAVLGLLEPVRPGTPEPDR